MNKEEFILNISPANGEPSKEYVMRLNTKLLLENEQLKEKINHCIEYIEHCPEYLWSNIRCGKLLEILKGGSNE